MIVFSLLLLLATAAFALLVQQPITGPTKVIDAVDGDILPSARLASAPYAKWATSHQVWLSSGDQNQTLDLQLVRDYLAYNIPVGAVEIDSQWSSGFYFYFVVFFGFFVF